MSKNKIRAASDLLQSVTWVVETSSNSITRRHLAHDGYCGTSHILAHTERGHIWAIVSSATDRDGRSGARLP